MTEENIFPPDHITEQVGGCFSVLGERTRLRILRSVCHEEKCVADIVADVGSSQTNVSRHLGVMHRAGVGACLRTGSLVYCEIAYRVYLTI